jgi:uncharacterized membrane protein YphA (DoxX/SURF4 family)
MESDPTVTSWVESRLTAIAERYAPNRRFLAMLRIAFGIWVVAFPVDVSWIGAVPAEFFHPRPGLFAFLTGPPSDSVLTFLVALTAVLGILVALGVFTIPASLALSAALIVSSGLSYSYSKVDHFILFELTPVFLAFAGWGKTWSLDAFLRKRRGKLVPNTVSGMPILLFAMTVGWAMLSAAFPKVAGDWVDPERQATRGYLARDLARDEKLGPLAHWAFGVDSTVFWKALDYATLLAEAGLILFVLWPLMFRLWLLLLISFHIGVFLTLGISFLDYILVYAVFFSPAYTWLGERYSMRAFDRGIKAPT